MTDREAMQQALDALDRVMSHGSAVQEVKDILRDRLAQPEQKPIAWVTGWHDGHCVIRAVDPALILPIGAALYTAPPQRKPLSDEEIIEWVESGEYNVTTNDWASHIAFARAIEAKLKEKNA